MIKWHEVTWYSKLGAIIFFIGVVPPLMFYIGMQYAETTAALPIHHKNIVEAPVYKKASLGGEIPSTWSEYWNGFGYISTPVNDERLIYPNSADGYAKYIMTSMSPYEIVFSDVPGDRLDRFSITPALRDMFIARAKKAGTYSTAVLGGKTFDVITPTYIQTEEEASEGGEAREYFIRLPDASDGTQEVAMFVEFQGAPDFESAVTHYLSTLHF